MQENSIIEPMAIDRDAISTLLGTDRLYFELGARRSSDSGLDLLYLDGCLTLPSGSVVWGIDRHCGERRLLAMLAAAEAELVGLGGTTMRIYMEDPVAEVITDTFRSTGYSVRTELALWAPVARILQAVKLPAGHTLHVVTTESDWRLKEQLHEEHDEQPDGYRTAPGSWISLERRKSETGGMTCYLHLDGDKPVAAVSLIRDRGVARLKNLFVRPSSRRNGIGLTTVGLLAKRSADLGYRQFGCFAHESGLAVNVYQRAGLRTVASVTEFSKSLERAG